MDPRCAILCRIATEALERASSKSNQKVCRCRGSGAGCEWMGEALAVATHEDLCLYYTKTLVFDLTNEKKKLQEQVKNDKKKLEALANRLGPEKKEAKERERVALFKGVCIGAVSVYIYLLLAAAFEAIREYIFA